MPVGRGFGSLIGLGRETVYGTPVARTVGIYFVSESLSTATDYYFSESLRDFSVRGHNIGKKITTGGIDVEVVANGHEMLWRSLFGSVTTTSLGGTPTAYQHVFRLVDALPSLSLEVQRDIQAFLYAGAKVTGCTITADTGAFLRASFDIIAREETQITKSTLTVPAPGEFFVFTQGTMKIDGVAIPVRSCSITITNALADDRINLGSAMILEPVRNSFVDVTGEITLEFTNDGSVNFLTEYAKFLSGATASIDLHFVGSIISGTNPYTFRIQADRIVYTGTTPNATDPGIIVGSLPFKALLSTETDREIRITLINTTASVG